MFNLNKTEVKESDIKENVSKLVDTAKQGASEVASDVKATATKLGNKIQDKSKEAQDEATQLLESLKTLLAQYTDNEKATEVKNQIVDKAAEIKTVVQEEVTHAYKAGKAHTVQTVQEKPLLSLAVALGAGVLVGYILGNKHSDK